MTKIATVRVDGHHRAARVDGAQLTLLPFEDVRELLRSGEDWREHVRGADGPTMELASAELAPVVPSPGKIFCVGLNFLDHAAEADRQVPDYPMLFAKFSGALVGARDRVMMPSFSDMIDWEAELAIVIGRSARHVEVKGASSHIAGFALANDVSVRDWQRRTSQFLQGKTFERTTPVGPWLATSDEIELADVRISCAIDGETVQRVSVSDMIFSPAELVSYVSQIITLDPGDLILSGTGSGIGAARTPPRFLSDGCRMVTSANGLGSLENICTIEAAAA